MQQQLTLLLRQFIFFSLPFLFANCNGNQSSNEKNVPLPANIGAERIKIDGLNEALTKLKSGKAAYQFIGITSNGVDCIYFVYENGKFNLEFEAMGEDQLLFIDKLTEFANANNFKYLMTSYNNKPNYNSNKPAPVLRIEINATIDEAIKLGTKIQSEIFHNDYKTVYDVVP